MAKIYYGNGEAEIDTTDVIICTITVKYPIEIDDKTPYEYVIQLKPGNRIIIFALRGKIKNNLKELFTYKGDLKILSATVINLNGDRQSCTLKRVMDYSELLNTKAEDMTTKSEDLKATSIYQKKIAKMSLVNPVIGDLECKVGQFYLEDGSEYAGWYHFHHDSTQRMTGRTHTEESQNLYFKEEYEGEVIDKLILANRNNYANTMERRIRGATPHLRRRRK